MEWIDTWLAIKTERNTGAHSLNSPGLPVTHPVFHPNPVWVAGARSANHFLSFFIFFFNCCFVKISVAWWLTICQSEAQTCLSEHQTSFRPVISHTFHDILTFSTSNFLQILCPFFVSHLSIFLQPSSFHHCLSIPSALSFNIPLSIRSSVVLLSSISIQSTVLAGVLDERHHWINSIKII